MATRLILDTNLWSYIGDERTIADLRRQLNERQCTVVLPPSMLIELLRNPHRESRIRHVEAMTSMRGIRLASEAQLCAEDFIKTVRRLRPGWKRSIADMATVAKYNREWTKSVWRWATDTDKAHQAVTGAVNPAKSIVDAQRGNRRAFLRHNFVSDYRHALIAADSPADAAKYIPGWDGKEVEAWRFDLAARYWLNMSTRRGNSEYNSLVQTHRDWIGSRIDLKAATADPGDFADFWFNEVAVVDVPRDWLRGALAYTQTTMKIGRGEGNAADEQHSAYLLDADLFLTSDRVLVNALTEVAKQAPFQFAQPRRVKHRIGHQPVVDAICSTIDRK